MRRSLFYLNLSLALGLSLTLLFVGLLSGGLPAARAATLDVCPTCTYTTIQAAANAAFSGDVISITAGTYNENVTITNKALTFVGAGMGSTIVDGGGAGRVFSSTSDLALADLTVQNGSATSGDGGGLYTAAVLTLTNVAVLSNTASLDGGGVYAGGAAMLSGGLFQNN
ncbi:MAG: hypothetical protein JW953_24380, partial [Anaerolineae bacterium]|nr:hypothetical protein [Anaerolineae bacterium]